MSGDERLREENKRNKVKKEKEREEGGRAHCLKMNKKKTRKQKCIYAMMKETRETKDKKNRSKHIHNFFLTFVLERKSVEKTRQRSRGIQKQKINKRITSSRRG